jgi:hypothetical protein
MLVPFVAFLAMLDAVASLDEENVGVAKLTHFLLGMIGLVVVGFALYRAFGDYRNLGTVDTLRDIALAPLMSIAFIPFIYLIVVLTTYEHLFVRLTMGRRKGEDVIRYAKRRIILHCGLSLGRLRSIARLSGGDMMRIESIEDVDRVLTAIEARVAG